MRKVVIHRPGGWDRLELETHPEPTPGAGEVLLDVAYAGVNFADTSVRMGLYESAKKYVGWPITPGFEVSGRVAAVGAGVDAALVGREVFGLTRFGAYADKLVTQAGMVFPLPTGFSLRESAGFPAVHLTAWFALSELARPRPGSRLLVHSAAGGVGTALVQQGRAMSCHVTGVVGSAAKVATARAAGADEVIDKSSEPLWERARAVSPDGYDVVLDANGVETLRGSWDHLRPAGRLVVYGFHSMLERNRGRPNWLKLARDWLRTPRFNPLDMTTSNRSVLAFNLSFLFDRTDILAEAMTTLGRWAEEGRLRPVPVQEFALERVADAHRAIESGTTVGKLVLAMR